MQPKPPLDVRMISFVPLSPQCTHNFILAVSILRDFDASLRLCRGNAHHKKDVRLYGLSLTRLISDPIFLPGLVFFHWQNTGASLQVITTHSQFIRVHFSSST